MERGARAFNVTVTMKNQHGKPLVGECHYGIPGGDYPVAMGRSGELKLENVLPGQFLIGYEGEEQLVTIHDDESMKPDELIGDVD